MDIHHHCIRNIHVSMNNKKYMNNILLLVLIMRLVLFFRHMLYSIKLAVAAIIPDVPAEVEIQVSYGCTWTHPST